MERNGAKRVFLRDVYSEIAERYGITANGVDCGIRSVIEKAWLKGRALRSKDIFGGGIKPTSSQLIFYLSNCLKKASRKK